MLINIDIKIADDSGNLVHHFEKRFDDEDTLCLEQLKSNYDGGSFDNFLSEYMSLSGYAVKEKLISGSAAGAATNTFLYSAATDPSNRETVHAASNGNIEYRISIGDKPVFARTISYSKAPIITNASNPSVSAQNVEADILPQNQEAGAGDSTLDYALQKAIAKYEANLFTVPDEENYPYQESDLLEDFF